MLVLRRILWIIVIAGTGILSLPSFAACVSQGSDRYYCQSTGDPAADGLALWDFLNNRQFACGSTIVLDSGADYHTFDFGGNLPGFGIAFRLWRQENCGDAYTTITSTRANELPEGKRVTPADRPKMAVLRTRASNSVFELAGAGANRWRIVGVAMTGSSVQSQRHYVAPTLALGHSFDLRRSGEEAVDIIFDRVLIYPYEEEAYGDITGNRNGNSWLRTGGIAIYAVARNFQLLNSSIFGFTGYERLGSEITATNVSQGNPAILTATGISASLGLNLQAGATSCTLADSQCIVSGGMRRVVLVGATGDWEDLNGSAYLVANGPDQVKVYKPNRQSGFYGTQGADTYNGSGKRAWTGTAQVWAAGLLTQYGFVTAWGGPYKIINNFIETWAMGILMGGADTPVLDPATILSGSTVQTLILSHVRGLHIGDLISVDVPENSPRAAACISSGWGCWAGNMLRAGKVTAIQDNAVTVVPYGADAIDVAPTVGGVARWRGEVIHDLEIRRNSVYKNPNQLFADAGKGPIEIKQATNMLVDGNILGPATNGNYFVTTRDQGGRSPWMTTLNAVFSNNMASGPDGAIQSMTIQADDNEHSNIGSENVWFVNNLHIGIRSAYAGNTPSIAVLNGLRKSGGYAHNTNTVLPNQNVAALFHLGCNLATDWGVTRGASIKDNIWGFGSGISTTLTGVECWPDKRNGVRTNIFIDTINMGAGTISSLWPGNTALATETGLFKGPCTYDTWENCELPVNSPYKGSASDGKDPGADILQLKDRTNGWSEDAGLLVFDTTIPGARNNPGAFSLNSTGGSIRFKLFNDVSQCKVELFINPARTILHADTDQPVKQLCTRSGNSLEGEEVVIQAGTLSPLAPATTYHYRITDGARVMVGSFPTEP